MDRNSQNNSADILAPISAHDKLSFEALRSSYNFRNISERRRIYSNLIVDDLKSIDDPTVLDIGCGSGMARDDSWQWAIKPHVGTYVGIEPDPGVVPADGLYDVVQNATMETATLEPNSIDLAYSWMVMEHVEHPVEFCKEVYRVLKPGGSYYFATPNKRHYFTIMARLFNLVRLDEVVLSMIHKKEKLDDYHYPVQYRFNSESDVTQAAESVGFQKPEFAYIEVEGPIKYFPGPTKVVFHALAWKRTIVKSPQSLLTMIGRITKPNTEANQKTDRTAIPA